MVTETVATCGVRYSFKLTIIYIPGSEIVSCTLAVPPPPPLHITCQKAGVLALSLQLFFSFFLVSV